MRKSSRLIWKDYLIISILLVIVVIILAIIALGLFYPQSYKDIVVSLSEEINVDSVLVMSIIRTESNFNHKALSSKGAVGLMQVMPNTAEWVAEKFGYNAKYDLCSPSDNIAIACKYLKYLTDKYRNQDLVIIAYNAGEGNLDKWLSLATDTELKIPFKETEQYLKKVKSAYNVYNKLM